MGGAEAGEGRGVHRQENTRKKESAAKASVCGGDYGVDGECAKGGVVVQGTQGVGAQVGG